VIVLPTDYDPLSNYLNTEPVETGIRDDLADVDSKIYAHDLLYGDA
jgi:hypothetical protein